MNIENNVTELDDFPYDLSDDFGNIIHAENQCPGVWYVANEGNGVIAGEYYIVERDAPCISKAAKAYGMFLPNHPELLAYRADDPEHGRNALLYEVAMYRQKNGLPPRDGVPVLDTAVFGMENNPEYFGSYPAPIHTPHGALTRYKSIINGVIALETNEGERMIALCYPIWNAALSDYAVSLAEQTEYGLANNIHKTLGYLFFAETHGCIALFELLGEFPQILSSPLIDAAALGNAVWQNHPEYAAIYNRNEQEGLHDCLAGLLRFLGVEDVEPTASPDRLIKLTLGVGADYLKL